MTELREKLNSDGVYLIKNAINEEGLQDIRARVNKWKKQFYDNIDMFLRNMSEGTADSSQLLDGQKERIS